MVRATGTQAAGTVAGVRAIGEAELRAAAVSPVTEAGAHTGTVGEVLPTEAKGSGEARMHRPLGDSAAAAQPMATPAAVAVVAVTPAAQVVTMTITAATAEVAVPITMAPTRAIRQV